jgi:hypothetical protein
MLPSAGYALPMQTCANGDTKCTCTLCVPSLDHKSEPRNDVVEDPTTLLTKTVARLQRACTDILLVFFYVSKHTHRVQYPLSQSRTP